MTVLLSSRARKYIKGLCLSFPWYKSIQSDIFCIFLNFFRKTFGGSEKSRTFASANEETTSEAHQERVLWKDYIRQKVVQEATAAMLPLGRSQPSMKTENKVTWPGTIRMRLSLSTEEAVSSGASRIEALRYRILQWRVWSWLRMNASYRLNTCKSRGSMVLAC